MAQKHSRPPEAPQQNFAVTLAQAFGADVDRCLMLKYEIDRHVLHYGAHFRSPYEKPGGKMEDPTVVDSSLDTLTEALHLLLEDTHGWLDSYLNLFSTSSDIVFSNAYVSNSQNSWVLLLKKMGLAVASPPWASAPNGSAIQGYLSTVAQTLREIFSSNFKVLFSQKLHRTLAYYEELLLSIFSSPRVKALIVPYTLPYFEIAAIKSMQQLDKATILAIHGLPTMYAHQLANHPVDYLAVWGTALKRNLVATGVPEERIIISGHPDYTYGFSGTPLRNTLDNVLVLGKPNLGASSRDVRIVQNRHLVLNFIARIETVLKSVGVTKARLRPHPSEDPSWYARFVDTSFFSIDMEPVAQSLAKATLVIGGPSTFLLDSLVHGVNYHLFDLPDDYNPCGYQEGYCGPPFDKSDPRVVVSHSEGELRQSLLENKSCNTQILEDYIQPDPDLEGLKRALFDKPPRPLPWD